MAISPSSTSSFKNTPNPKIMVEEISTQTYSLNRDTPPISTTSSMSPKSTVPQNTKSFSESNPEYFQIDLPSNFTPYPFKTLSACHLKGFHQAKFSRAAKEDKIRYVVEAVSSTLEPSVSAFDLTPADFYFLMYWQRVNSYSSMPLITEVMCENTEHLTKVYAGYKEEDSNEENSDEEEKSANSTELKFLPESSLKNKLILKNTTLDVATLETLDLTKFEKIAKYDLGYETMRDVVESAENIEKMFQKSLDNPESDIDIEGYTWLAAKAAFLDNHSNTRKLTERIKIIEGMTVEETSLLDTYIDTVTQYGVSETTKFRCQECGGFTEIKFSINPLTFL